MTQVQIGVVFCSFRLAVPQPPPPLSPPPPSAANPFATAVFNRHGLLLLGPLKQPLLELLAISAWNCELSRSDTLEMKELLIRFPKLEWKRKQSNRKRLRIHDDGEGDEHEETSPVTFNGVVARVFPTGRVAVVLSHSVRCALPICQFVCDYIFRCLDCCLGPTSSTSSSTSSHFLRFEAFKVDFFGATLRPLADFPPAADGGDLLFMKRLREKLIEEGARVRREAAEEEGQTQQGAARKDAFVIRNVEIPVVFASDEFDKTVRVTVFFRREREEKKRKDVDEREGGSKEEEEEEDEVLTVQINSSGVVAAVEAKSTEDLQEVSRLLLRPVMSKALRQV